MFKEALAHGSTSSRRVDRLRSFSFVSLSKQRSIAVSLLQVWLVFHAVILLGYALFGRGFAYVGIGNIYVGELCLCLGTVWLATFRQWGSLLRSELILGVLALQVWGAICTLPYLGRYGINALRDAVLWGYSWYAIIVAAAIVSSPYILETMLRRYRLFAIVFLSCVPVLWCAFLLFPSRIPVWHGTEVPLIGIRSSEVLVHLAGVFCFFASGLGGPFGPFMAVLLVGSAGMAGSVSRGGLLAFIACVSLASVMGQTKRALVQCLIVASISCAFMVGVDVKIPVSYEGRPVSAGQLIMNVFSTVTTTRNAGALEDTKEWRLAWWRDIYEYTVDGPYLLTGKGYGINLADSDGFQVLDDDSLRNPHNSHLTFLARSGVPGFILWVALLCLWFAKMTSSYWDARRLRRKSWAGLFLFVICYTLSVIINAMFDPALEGPMLGIWFWSVVGLGIGASLVCPRRPSRLEHLNEPIARE